MCVRLVTTTLRVHENQQIANKSIVRVGQGGEEGAQEGVRQGEKGEQDFEDARRYRRL
jgi:hypothetical protein